MEFEQILKDLKSQKYHPIYFLQGEEPYFIDVISDYISENVLDESEKGFDQTILYGKEVDVVTLVGYAKRYPMIAKYQVVIVKEAQDMKNIDALQSYFENPLSSTILVLCHKYKSLDKRTKLSKTISGKAVLLQSDKIYENKVPDWVNKYVATKNYKIQAKASLMIAEYLGNDLSKVANELDKLMLNVPSGSEITVKHIEDNIGISKEFNVFELQTALAKRDVLKANQIVNYFAANPKNNPFIVTVTNLFGYFNKILVYHTLEDKSKGNVASVLKINPYFVGDYEVAAKTFTLKKVVDVISELRDYDLKSKGVGATNSGDGELLKELVFKILH